MFRTHWDVGAEHTWSICRRCAEPFHRWARQLFCVILSSKSGGVCGWLIEVGILDAHGVCCFSVIKPGKIWCLLLCCYCCSECTSGMFLWNVPQSKFSDCRLDIRRTSGESLQQHIKKQTTGGWCHLLKNGARCDLQCHMWHVLYLLILLLDKPGVMLCRKDWSTSFTWHKGPWKRHGPPRYMTARTVTPDRSGQVCLFPSDMPLILWLSLSQEVCDL